MFKKVKSIDKWVETKKICPSEQFDLFKSEIINSDQVLTKFYKFAFLPDIESNFLEFPIRQKLKQLEEISEEDWRYLELKAYTATGIERHCLKLLKNKSYVLNNLIQRGVDNESLESQFNIVSRYRITEFRNKDIIKIKRSTGFFYPLIWVITLAYRASCSARVPANRASRWHRGPCLPRRCAPCPRSGMA